MLPLHRHVRLLAAAGAQRKRSAAGYRRAHIRFIGVDAAGKHDDTSVIPPGGFTLPPHTHEVEEATSRGRSGQAGQRQARALGVGGRKAARWGRAWGGG